MKHLYLTLPFVLSFFAFSIALPLPSEENSEVDTLFAQNYLKNFYHFTTNVRGRSCSQFSAKVREMQRFFHLDVTGFLNNDTMDEMKTPRCGVSDIGEYRAFPGRPKWNKNEIKYSIQNYTPDMKRSDVDIAIQRALKLWSDVTPLRFTRSSSSQADIKIFFSSRAHGDGQPFDGPAGTLAHAFSPSSGLGGDIHFDEDERWTKDSRDFNLFLVAGHEIGHALGLDHSNDRKALMFPTYWYVNTNGYRLPADDVRGIQSIYGPPISAPVPKPPKTPRPPNCNPNLSIDAATKLNGDTLFFKDKYYIRKNSRTSKVVAGFIKSTWSTVPSSIDAAFESSQGFAFFIKGSKYWAISGNSVLRGYPRSISDFNLPRRVRKIDAAVRISTERKILFFAGNIYWSYDEHRRQMDRGYPRLIASDFQGFRSKVDAVFHNDGLLYLSSGSVLHEYWYFQWNRKATRLLIRKLTLAKWMNC